jgi:hypothetical protein
MLTGNMRPYLRLMARRRPSLIHAHFGIEGVAALALALRLEIPLVTTFHGFDATLEMRAMLGSPAWFRYPLLRRTLRAALATAPISQTGSSEVGRCQVGI